MLSLAAAALYILVALSCLIAARTAVVNRQVPWHLRSWMFLAVLFATLTLFRVFALEEIFRNALRLMLDLEGAYEDRRDLQGPIAAIIIIAAVGLGGWWIYRMANGARGRRNIAAKIAQAGGAAMIALLAVRIVSLHALDALLYGPAKINWIGDIGLSCAVMGCAITYWRVVPARR